MMILIDGYNLLHVTGLSGRGLDRPATAPGTLQRARNALLNFLATSLDDTQRRRTTVAFDSSGTPPGLPREFQHQGITVKYATGYESADELLEELIRDASAPRRLTVVSSDHRVQRAAKRRRARAVDSDVWYAEIRGLSSGRQPTATSHPKPTCPLSDAEVAAWLEEFGELLEAEPSVTDLALSEPLTGDDSAAPASVENPFPPGYAEDLLDDD